MASDAAVRWAARSFTLLAAILFLGWIAAVDPLFLLGALLSGAVAYAFFLIDRDRHFEELQGYGRDEIDRVREGADPVVSPGVSAAGIHLSFFTRSRWRAKR